MWKKIKTPLLLSVLMVIVIMITIPLSVKIFGVKKSDSGVSSTMEKNTVSALYSEADNTNGYMNNAKNNKMDIVDTQVHIGPGGIVETLASMDALGINTVLIDELWTSSMDQAYYKPNIMLENNVGRPINPTAQLATQMYPNRFAYILRLEREDPEVESMIQKVAEDPSGKAVRIVPGLKMKEIEAFIDGEYDNLMAAAEKNKLPLMIYLPDQPDAIAKAAEKFPNLKIVVDHLGIYNNDVRKMFGGAVPLKSGEEQSQLFDQVLALSKYPNIALKWSHASENFETPVFPGEEVKPYLRRAIDHFGADRIMWASDFSVNTRGETWSEILYGIKANSELTEEEMTAILGGTAKSWLDLK